ncbi:MAG: hypothetical protein AB7K24_30725 [Gemmataceae bacterium]
MSECDKRGIRLIITRDGRVTLDAPRDALSPELLERVRTHKAELFEQLGAKAPHEQKRSARPGPAKPVCRCGSSAWREVAIHDGQSTRRDCARCGRFVDFSHWYGAIALQAGE